MIDGKFGIEVCVSESTW